MASWSLTSLPSRVGAGLVTLVITNSSTNIHQGLVAVVPVVPTSAANGVPSSCVVTVPTSSMVGWRVRRPLNSSAKNSPRRHWEVTSQTSWQDERPPWWQMNSNKYKMGQVNYFGVVEVFLTRGVNERRSWHRFRFRNFHYESASALGPKVRKCECLVLQSRFWSSACHFTDTDLTTVSVRVPVH